MASAYVEPHVGSDTTCNNSNILEMAFPLSAQLGDIVFGHKRKAAHSPLPPSARCFPCYSWSNWGGIVTNHKRKRASLPPYQVNLFTLTCPSLSRHRCIRLTNGIGALVGVACRCRWSLFLIWPCAASSQNRCRMPCRKSSREGSVTTNVIWWACRDVLFN